MYNSLGAALLNEAGNYGEELATKIMESKAVWPRLKPLVVCEDFVDDRSYPLLKTVENGQPILKILESHDGKKSVVWEIKRHTRSWDIKGKVMSEGKTVLLKSAQPSKLLAKLSESFSESFIIKVQESLHDLEKEFFSTRTHLNEASDIASKIKKNAKKFASEYADEATGSDAISDIIDELTNKYFGIDMGDDDTVDEHEMYLDKIQDAISRASKKFEQALVSELAKIR